MAPSAALFQLHQHLSGNFFERLENALALERHGFNYGLVLALEFFRKRFNGKDVGKVALIKLQNIRNLIEVVTVLFQVRHQIVERFGVGVHSLLLRVGNENDSVDAAQDQLPAGVVENLSWDSIEMDSCLESANGTE